MSQTRYPSMHYNTIVIGAGPSGLASAKCLQEDKIDYVVLEASQRVVNSWHAVWPDFRLAQPVKDVSMPGLNLSAFDPNYHLKRDEIISVFENYYQEYALKITFNVQVTIIQKDSNNFYQVKTTNGDFTAENIILSVGARQQPKFPACVEKIPEEIRKEKIIHSAWYQGYKSFSENSSILVVGSGLSAISIVTDLIGQTSGFKVTIACDYTTAEIKHNNRHLKSFTTLEDLRDAGVEQLGGLYDVLEKKCDLFFNGKKEGINIHSYEKVIFATGYNVSYELLNKILDGNVPSHYKGVSTEPGLYMVGIPTEGEKTVTITNGGKEAAMVVNHIRSLQRQKETSSMRYIISQLMPTEEKMSESITKGLFRKARHHAHNNTVKLSGKFGMFRHKKHAGYDKRLSKKIVQVANQKKSR